MRMPTAEEAAEALKAWMAEQKPANTNGDTPDTTEQTAVQTRLDEFRLALRDADGLRKIPPPDPIIHGYLHRNSLTWIGGKPGHGKSFIAIDIACCIATGTTWHNNQTEPGTVLYIIAEGASGLSQRVDAWMQHQHHTTIPNLKFLPIAVQLTEETDLTALGMLLADTQPDLVIIDTQARVTVGLEENSAKDMGQFVQNLEYLRQQSRSCFLTVHHTPRSGDNLRGSIALEGAADTILLATKDGDQITIVNQKQKNSVAMADMELILETHADSAVLIQPDPVQQSQKLGKTQLKILEVLEEFPEEWVSSGRFQGATGLDKGFYRPVNKLIDAGYIDFREGAGRKEYKLVKTP